MKIRILKLSLIALCFALNFNCNQNSNSKISEDIHGKKCKKKLKKCEKKIERLKNRLKAQDELGLCESYEAVYQMDSYLNEEGTEATICFKVPVGFDTTKIMAVANGNKINCIIEGDTFKNASFAFKKVIPLVGNHDKVYVISKIKSNNNGETECFIDKDDPIVNERRRRSVVAGTKPGKELKTKDSIKQ